MTQAEPIVQAVLASRKYRTTAAHVVQHLADAAVARYPDSDRAEAEVRRALHLAVSAPCPAPLNVTAWRKRYAACKDAGERSTVCRDLLQRHASTRERLPEMAQFYASIFSAVGPVHSVLDLGCGVNPAALPWMGLPSDVRYHALDARSDITSVIQAGFDAAGVHGLAEPADLLGALRCEPADVALMLKLLPALERLEPGSAIRLMRNVPAPALVVSFPTTSLGGAQRGMDQNYSQLMRVWLADEPWRTERLGFRTETAFIVWKQR
ncbi:MAG: hypothetical protein KGJ62_03075 [Armatimonadetes bacterium]|nr:hypothetical protein [Armatimonadota bacterium]MDE2207194.1 hypothetical protein [Armatimonadota bacterium]